MDEHDYVDKLFAFYNEQVEHARHHEVMRAEATNYILVGSTGLIGLLSAATVFGATWDFRSRVIIAGVIAVLNAYGILLSYKHYERNRLHVSIARKYRAEISERCVASGFPAPNEMREAGRTRSEKKYPCTSRIRLHVLWMSLHAIFILIALALTQI